MLTLGNNLDGTWSPHLIQANTDWNVSDQLENSVGTGNAADANCAPVTGAFEVCNFNYGNNGWLGIAGVWVAKGKNITRAYVKLNDYYFDMAFYNTDAWRQMVTCQEIGHGFGLDHQDVNFTNTNLGTCMDYTNNPLGPPSNVAPDQHDRDQLTSMYGKKEKGGGGGGKPGGGGPPGKNKASFAPLSGGNSEWGRAIGFDGNGNANKFELDLGNGNKLITHVLWAN
jgi:hypothetical protein